MTARRAVVTGAGGFVGRALCAHLSAAGWSVLALVHGRSQLEADRPPGTQYHHVGDLLVLPSADLARLLDGADVVFHLAARAHRGESGTRDAEAVYRRDNLAMTRQVGVAAARAGVGTFVYASSIKALADTSEAPLSPHDTPRPADAYGRSKLAAEQCLRSLAAGEGMNVAVVRPPLVHGPGVRGNLATLLRALQRGWPLPLAHAAAPRSMVGISNLCDLLVRLAEHRQSFRIYHVRDDVELDAAALVRRCAALMGRRAKLVPVPPAWIRTLDRISGRDFHGRLFQPLRVDDSATREALAWQPPVSIDDGLAEMVRGWPTQG